MRKKFNRKLTGFILAVMVGACVACTLTGCTQPPRMGIKHNADGTAVLRYPKALKDELGENITIYCGCGETHCFSLQN